MLVYGGFDGTMLNDVITYEVGECKLIVNLVIFPKV